MLPTTRYARSVGSERTALLTYGLGGSLKRAQHNPALGAEGRQFLGFQAPGELFYLVFGPGHGEGGLGCEQVGVL
ncbi:MAG TPA: hypothetical protein VII53_08635, partial [Solirubrobacteraceae bacterium]